jgi:hypothetical protein
VKKNLENELSVTATRRDAEQKGESPAWEGRALGPHAEGTQMAQVAKRGSINLCTHSRAETGDVDLLSSQASPEVPGKCSRREALSQVRD